jgi:hypothetical protein
MALGSAGVTTSARATVVRRSFSECGSPPYPSRLPIQSIATDHGWAGASRSESDVRGGVDSSAIMMTSFRMIGSVARPVRSVRCLPCAPA